MKRMLMIFVLFFSVSLAHAVKYEYLVKQAPMIKSASQQGMTKWLNEMAKDGWKMIQKDGANFYFIRGVK